MAKVITFGEIMMRLSPEGFKRFVQADTFTVVYGGAESNVAVSLSHFGIDTAFVTKLPAHQIGDAALNELRKFGVDTQHIARGGNRLGIYYAENGASQRGSFVIYDRAGSSMQTATASDFDWDSIFANAEWFHFTGITPALGNAVAAICLEACKKAKAKKLTISCDLNFRKKLWSTEQAEKIMSELMQYVDVCIANEEDAEKVFGIKGTHSDVTAGKLDTSDYEAVAKQLAERFNFSQVAITLRTSMSASDNRWAALLYDGKKYYSSKEYAIRIVDRVGGGDSFGAGLIYGNMMHFEPQKIVEFAVAASCLKHTIEGDFNHVSVEEVERLMNGDTSGRVSR
ncbi:MAG: sugar kinase [Treponema sp.]|nr:sugar kinase [Treponema sp.]